MVCNPKLLSVSVRVQSGYWKQWIISKGDLIKERLEEQKWEWGYEVIQRLLILWEKIVKNPQEWIQGRCAHLQTAEEGGAFVVSARLGNVVDWTTDSYSQRYIAW